MADKVKVDTGFGIIWFIGWLFTIGFLKLGFLKGVFALLVWPYYIGSFLNTFLPGKALP